MQAQGLSATSANLGFMIDVTTPQPMRGVHSQEQQQQKKISKTLSSKSFSSSKLVSTSSSTAAAAAQKKTLPSSLSAAKPSSPLSRARQADKSATSTPNRSNNTSRRPSLQGKVGGKKTWLPDRPIYHFNGTQTQTGSLSRPSVTFGAKKSSPLSTARSNGDRPSGAALMRQHSASAFVHARNALYDLMDNAHARSATRDHDDTDK